MEGVPGTGIYCRLSTTRQGDTTKVDDQQRISRNLAKARKMTIAAGVGHPEPDGVYTDNSESAWKRNRKRPAWDQMLADIEAGMITSLIVYHGDRLIRQPYDLELLLNLADQRGMVIASPTGEYQLDSPHDRFVLRILTAKACLESDDISRRKKTGFERMALEGVAPVPGGRGGRAFGYEADGRTPHPVEATAIEQAAQRLLDGDGLTVICRDLGKAGITSTTGKPLTYETLRRILLRPRTAGLLRDGRPGSWRPLIAPATQEELRNLFATKARKQPAGMKYLLTGIAACGECHKPVQAVTSGGNRCYGCVTRGCMRIRRSMPHTDAYVTGFLLEVLNRPEVTAAVPQPQGDDPVAGEITKLETRMAEALEVLATLHNRPGASAKALAQSVAGYEQRIAVLRAQATPNSRRIAARHAGLTLREFKALHITMRRQLVRSLLRVTIDRASRRGPGFCPDDVDVRLRDD